ncbi:MAG TPA: ankyrin repeat domain-containing protein [Bacteroidales bacterium]|nr:ankyrin repeat domain-containing protein [Bacteroidales bacterium]
MRKIARYIGFMLILFIGHNVTLNAQVEVTPDYDLIMAADAGSLKHVRIAVIEGANVDAKTENGVTPLMYAAQGGYLDIVEFLVEMDAKIDTKPYESNRTALMAAVENGHVEIAEFLIRKGADISLTDYRGRNLMHYAALCGVWEMTDLLLYYGMFVDPLDEEKRTPLMLASYDGYDATVRVLLENDAKPDLSDENGNTAMHMAAQNGHDTVISELIDAGADTEIINDEGYAPLDMATMYGRFESSKTLVENQANIRDSIKPSFNLLTLAKKSGNKDLAKYLKEKGATRNFRPYVNSMGLGMDVIANGNNTFLTGILSIHEDKYNLNLDLFAGSRTKAILVPLEISDYSTYLLYEDRHVAGIGLNKDFDIFKPISGWRYGINTGVLHTYSWATYKGYRPHPTPEFTTGGSVSAFAKYDFFRIATGYQYLKFPSLNYRPHHFFLRIQVFLRFNDDIYYNILI